MRTNSDAAPTVDPVTHAAPEIVGASPAQAPTSGGHAHTHSSSGPPSPAMTSVHRSHTDLLRPAGFGLVDTSLDPGDTPPPRRRGRPRDPQADTRILAAAAELMMVRGFDAMTVDDVASRAHVGKATVYRRWARKEDLALAAMRQLYRTQVPMPDTGSLVGDLRATYRAVLHFADSEAGQAYISMSIGESLRDPRIATLYREAVLSAETSARTMFDRAVDRGEIIDPGHRVDFAIRWLAGILTLHSVIQREAPDLDSLDDAVEFALRGLGVA